jgi:hypothetical protein
MAMDDDSILEAMCTRCGYEWSNGWAAATTPSGTPCPGCGDTEGLTLLAALATISGDRRPYRLDPPRRWTRDGQVGQPLRPVVPVPGRSVSSPGVRQMDRAVARSRSAWRRAALAQAHAVTAHAHALAVLATAIETRARARDARRRL